MLAPGGENNDIQEENDIEKTPLQSKTREPRVEQMNKEQFQQVFAKNIERLYSIIE